MNHQALNGGHISDTIFASQLAALLHYTRRVRGRVLRVSIRRSLVMHRADVAPKVRWMGDGLHGGRWVGDGWAMGAGHKCYMF